MWKVFLFGSLLLGLWVHWFPRLFVNRCRMSQAGNLNKTCQWRKWFWFPPPRNRSTASEWDVVFHESKISLKIECMCRCFFFVQRLSHRSNKGLAASVSLARVFMTATMIIHTISVLEQRKIHSVRIHRSHFLWLSLPGSPRFSLRCPHRKSQAWTYPGNSGVNLLLSLFC